MVNKENIKKWINALRSGKYQQTRNILKSSSGFCCLGVACDISGLDEWNKGRYLGRLGSLPEAVQNFYGIRTHNPFVLFNGTYVSLTYLNDILGLSFNEIADIIESWYINGS